MKFEVPDVPFWLDDRNYWPLWERISEESLLVAFDLGWDKTENPYGFQLKQLTELVENFPQMKIIVLHLGVSRTWDSSPRYPFPLLQQTPQLARYGNDKELILGKNALKLYGFSS